MTEPSPLYDLRRQRIASGLLVLACVCWGMSFTWAKSLGHAVNKAIDAKEHSPVGPIWGLGARFLLGALLWVMLSPSARRGWTRRTAWRSIVLGALLSISIIVQHLGLDRTSEAVSAFLTSLTVVFVPILAWVVSRKNPGVVMWAGVVVATTGVWLMTGTTPQGLGLGEVLGVACSVLWAVYILALAAFGQQEHPARLIAGQFIVAGLSASVFSFALSWRDPMALLRSTIEWGVWDNILLLTLFATLIAFAIQAYQQPRIDATRASLIYLSEPVFASIFAWAWAWYTSSSSKTMTTLEIAGACLILVANVAVEILASRARVVVPD